MKKTVKLLSLAAAIAMAATMTGCGGTKTTDENTNASATPASSDKKTLTMATNAEFPPFEYLEGDQIVGADVDMAKAVAFAEGRDYIVPRDVQNIFICTVNHRIILNAKASASKKNSEEILHEILRKTPKPRT